MRIENTSGKSHLQERTVKASGGYPVRVDRCATLVTAAFTVTIPGTTYRAHLARREDAEALVRLLAKTTVKTVGRRRVKAEPVITEGGN